MGPVLNLLMRCEPDFVRLYISVIYGLKRAVYNDLGSDGAGTGNDHVGHWIRIPFPKIDVVHNEYDYQSKCLREMIMELLSPVSRSLDRLTCTFPYHHPSHSAWSAH